MSSADSEKDAATTGARAGTPPPVRVPVRVYRDAVSGETRATAATEASEPGETVGVLPALYPEWLGDRTFLEAHGVRFPYVAGSMANGISTPAMVVKMAGAGMLGFFGAAGLSVDRVEAGLDEIVRSLDGRGRAWGANLIHSPNEPALERRVARLYAERDVPCVEVSAFMALTPAVVALACHGLRADAHGRVVRRHRILAKVSRLEVARRFMSPAPTEMLRVLVAEGALSEEEARLGARVPLANDLTVEADSGGHTDNRPLGALFPAIVELRSVVEAELGIKGSIRIGAAGGIGTPHAVAAAFALGAAYVLTGSVNQSAVESGLSEEGRRMLSEADIADVAMAASADMFELGVKVQVLKRGTLFAARANKLYEVYRSHASLDVVSAATRGEIEKIFGAPIDTVERATEAFWRERDPGQIDRARTDPRHRMALIFRWYLGNASRWAVAGEPRRRGDYQIWCGPAMGAFNAWVKGSFLEPPAERSVAQIARNLLEGAAKITRAHQLRSVGVSMSAAAFTFSPRYLR